MLKKGELPGRKVEGRWVFDSDKPGPPASPVDAPAVREALEQALVPRSADKKPYTVRSMRAFRHAVTLGGRAKSASAPPEAVEALTACTEALSLAIHLWHPRDKQAAFAQARVAGAKALARLHLAGGDHPVLADAIEADLMPAIAGLTRHLAGVPPLLLRASACLRGGRPALFPR